MLHTFKAYSGLKIARLLLINSYGQIHRFQAMAILISVCSVFILINVDLLVLVFFRDGTDLYWAGLQRSGLAIRLEPDRIVDYLLSIYHNTNIVVCIIWQTDLKRYRWNADEHRTYRQVEGLHRQRPVSPSYSVEDLHTLPLIK